MSNGTARDEGAIGWEVEELTRWRRRLALRVPPARARNVRDRTVRKFARQARLKGFRPGKAPAPLVERQYGPEIDQEVLEELVREGWQDGVVQAGLDPIAAPRIDGVRWTDEGGLEFAAEFDIRPEVELPRTGGFRVERPARSVGDADVDRVLERLRHERADWRPADRPAADGDRLVFDSVPLGPDGEPLTAEKVQNHQVELGSGAVLPDFEAGLAGVRAGEEREVAVAFPDDHPNEALRGVARTFRVTVEAVQERVLPALDDEFARSLGAFESLETARRRIRENLAAEIEQQSRREVNEALIDQVIEANRLDLPESMVDRYLDSMLSDRDGPLGGPVDDAGRRDELRRVLRPGAERALRRYTILNHLADREGLRATDEDVDAAIGERIDPEKTSLAEARRRLERSGELDDLRFHLTMERVFAWLRDRSTIITVESSDPE